MYGLWAYRPVLTVWASIRDWASIGDHCWKKPRFLEEVFKFLLFRV